MEPKRISECPKLQFKSLWIEKWNVIFKSQVLRYEKKNHNSFFTTFGIIGIGQHKKCHIGILSVLADKKIEFIGLYQYRADMKKSLWVVHWLGLQLSGRKMGNSRTGNPHYNGMLGQSSMYWEKLCWHHFLFLFITR